MAAELAFIDILRSDSNVTSYVGTGTEARISPIERPQEEAIPSIVIRRQDNNPSPTKDGPSTLDTEFIQVLMYANDMAQAHDMENAVRFALDRIRENTYNGVVIQSSDFDDNDTFAEQILNKRVIVVEHIYRVRVKR